MVSLMSLWAPILLSAVLVFESTVDGFVYGLLTGGAFAWLWPR
jgi:hypothetical protein